MKFREKRPRAKGVTRKKTEKGTSTRNRDYLTSQREQPKVSREIERRGKYPKKTRGLDLLQIWPKIVEYIGLSEYESKVYLSLVNLGVSGARKLSLNCDVPRTKVYGTLKKLIDYGARASLTNFYLNNWLPVITSEKYLVSDVCVYDLIKKNPF